eukprot:1158666-Pelagomonas_calceolata.AAC.2
MECCGSDNRWQLLMVRRPPPPLDFLADMHHIYFANSKRAAKVPSPGKQVAGSTTLAHVQVPVCEYRWQAGQRSSHTLEACVRVQVAGQRSSHTSEARVRVEVAGRAMELTLPTLPLFIQYL